MGDRIGQLAELADHAVYVASQDGAVVGWIDVGVAFHLPIDPRAEIGGLVVTANTRGNGVGRELLLRAEQWAKERGFSHVLVRSNVFRKAAHRFYLREGYERTKTSAVFTKRLQGE